MSIESIRLIESIFQFCTQLTKAFVAEMSYNQLLIDTAM